MHRSKAIVRYCSRLSFARLAAGGLLLGSALAVRAGEVDFLRDVRPILAGHCFKCHGQDEAARKSGLRLDVREAALKPLKSGAVAIVPNHPESSELVRRVETTDEEDLMPPPSAKNPLTEKQREILRTWVAEGAEYKPHWAFQKPSAPPVPSVKDPSWPRNPIDYFVLARLEKEGLKPGERADPYALVRRLYLDLIGLPPTPEQADEFVNDPSPRAYEQLVDRLLASPHYGERWARRWLDLARYADTNGYEKDRPRSIWPYRDWVIRALNADMPFDQFTIEQLAGDLLPNATLEQRVATGFHRNTMINEEGGIDPLEFRFYSMVDRVHVTATTWLGLTMACAQCHTHKYDPIEQSEYYKFMAFLNNADEPVLPLPQPDIAERRKTLEARIARLESQLPDQFPPERRIEWFVPAGGEFTAKSGAAGERLPDGSVRVSGEVPEKDRYTVTYEFSPRRITHVQLEAIPDETVGKGGPGRTDHGNFVLSEFEFEILENGGTKKLPFSGAEADFSQDGFPAEKAIDGKLESGWAPGVEAAKRPHRRVIFTLAEPIVLEKPVNAAVKLIQEHGGRHVLGRFRVSFGNDLNPPESAAELGRRHLKRRFAKWLEGELPSAIEWRELRPVEAKSETPVLTIEPDGSVFATGDFTKNDTYHLKFRGLPAKVTAIRLQALPDDRLPNGGPGAVYYEGPEGDFWLSNIKARASGKSVALTNATESYASEKNTAATAIDDDLQSGWSIKGAQGKEHNAVFQFAQPLESADELELDLTFERYYAAGLGRFRVWITTEPNARASALPSDAYQALLRHKRDFELDSLPEPDRAVLLREFCRRAPELANARKEIDDLRASLPKDLTTLVMRERAAGHTRRTFRHHRGEFLQPKEPVEPAVPAFLPGLPPDAPKNRLGLARWLVSPENPLTARVIMNRHWEAFFGRGLVRTAEDFGFQGELPSHPDLLDWLAVEFMRQGWSQKKMHKLIVMSATYQQSSRAAPDLLARDPRNVLLARGPRFRVEAEIVRDTALVASGLLAEKIGGPSVFPPQPAGVTTEGTYGPLRWETSSGADRYRRGLYTFAKRTAPYAMTLTYDGPSGEACLPRRDRSNTPLQALTLLNDEVFVECAKTLGAWAAAQSGSAEETARQVFRRCVTRSPRKDELQKVLQFYQAQRARFSGGELKAGDFLGKRGGTRLEDEAAWTALARVLLNLDETITKE